MRNGTGASQSEILDMGIKDRREREKLDRRNAILGAAEDLFREKGREATMDEIALRAELSKPTLYLYFKNKDDLYASIALAGFEELKDAYALISGSPGDAMEKVKAMFDCFVTFVMEHEQVARITEFVLSEAGRRKLSAVVAESVNNHISDLLDYASTVIRQGVDEGVLAEGMDPTLTSIVLWRCILGITEVAIEDGLPGRDRDFYRSMFDSALVILTDGIRKR